jgi:16S rRNA (adenine1518-N6/adenine1519-N6)-dimethyltransferase
MQSIDQHYMIDIPLLVHITGIADLHKNDLVLEIGSGTGYLTRYLQKIAKKLFVIEKDPQLLKELKEKFSNAKNITYIEGDATQLELPEFTKCVSNLPYTICEPLMWRFTREKFEMLVFVVPLSFAENLTGKNPSRLKLLCDAFYNVEIIQKISPESFYPKPKTESALIKITPNEGNFFLREFLIQYDKKTKNALREILMKSGMTKTESQEHIALRLKPLIQDKNIVNLSLEEIKEIVKLFAK